jgi:hypothetical protein
MIKNNKEIELKKKKDFFILKSIGEKTDLRFLIIRIEVLLLFSLELLLLLLLSSLLLLLLFICMERGIEIDGWWKECEYLIGREIQPIEKKEIYKLNFKSSGT